MPASWKLQYWDAGTNAFVDIPDATYTLVTNAPGAYGTDNGGWSEATWTDAVKTTKLRMVIQSGSASPAAAEWQVHAPEPTPDPEPEPTPDPTPIRRLSPSRNQRQLQSRLRITITTASRTVIMPSLPRNRNHRSNLSLNVRRS